MGLSCAAPGIRRGAQGRPPHSPRLVAAWRAFSPSPPFVIGSPRRRLDGEGAAPGGVAAAARVASLRACDFLFQRLLRVLVSPFSRHRHETLDGESRFSPPFRFLPPRSPLYRPSVSLSFSCASGSAPSPTHHEVRLGRGVF